MGRSNAVVSPFLALQSMAVLLSMHRADAQDFLSPLLPPEPDGLCHLIECGRGTCEETSESMFGFVCKCQKGWSQFHIGNNLRFLPCAIPNCSINFSCSSDSSTHAAPPSPSADNITSLDLCMLSYCGGGTCVKTENTFGHRCECKEGFSNLLDQTYLPCYRDCSFGADCKELGIPLSNSSPAPPSLPDSGGNSAGKGYNSAPDRLRWTLAALVFPVIMRWA